MTITFLYCVVPCVAVSLVMYFVMNRLLQRLYRKTPLQAACEEYMAQMKREGPQGPHGSEAGQGLEARTLCGLFTHFEGFLLQRNMHYVVGNLVLPLTAQKQCSFVTLCGNKPVDFFVWDIENELGETIEDSPFAKALRGNIRGVVMVLDPGVLPLT
ncbi:pmpB, partial [Symbiodinium pilosum]